MSKERLRINRLNNGFTSQKSLVKASPDFNLDIHEKSFDNLAPLKLPKDASAFLPPINKGCLENLKKNADLIKFEGTIVNSTKGNKKATISKNNLDSTSDRISLLEKLERKSDTKINLLLPNRNSND